MLNNLPYLFAAHRAALAEIARLKSVIADLEIQLAKAGQPAALKATMQELMQTFNDTVLSEQPFPEGKVPERLYLT